MMRTGTGRRGCVSRCRTFMNPRGSATGHLQDPRPNFLPIWIEALFEGTETGLLDRRIVARQDLRHAGCRVIEVLEQPLRKLRTCLLGVLGDKVAHDVAVLSVELEKRQLA